MIDYAATQNDVEVGKLWLRDHAGVGQTWEEALVVFFDERDRRQAGDEPQVPHYAYQELEKRFGNITRERHEGRGARFAAELRGAAERKATQDRVQTLLADPAFVAALERLVRREIGSNRD